ncbi:hypothetical protein P3L10_014326 [Capsicum annuum]|uniref:uncharacterized protein LOC107869876 n=1 Tax=Capsicum annuum TaxID=4072 RepID=UPI001FB17FAF|nr:uncharacterized protein LOC107869876 [Capsicum annuum]
MRNAIRCCIACIFPCGSLDVIRIVHSNGKVEEISDSHVKASEIMKLYPKHILKKPTSSYSSSSNDQDICSPKIVVVPPDAELQRGKIYFLMPMPSSSSSSVPRDQKSKTRSKSSTKNKKITHVTSEGHENGDSVNLLTSDQYLSDILSEKMSTQRYRRRGRVGVWRPHLESISETIIES